jgi:hypothetical protein
MRSVRLLYIGKLGEHASPARWLTDPAVADPVRNPNFHAALMVMEEWEYEVTGGDSAKDI